MTRRCHQVPTEIQCLGTEAEDQKNDSKIGSRWMCILSVILTPIQLPLFPDTDPLETGMWSAQLCSPSAQNLARHCMPRKCSRKTWVAF